MFDTTWVPCWTRGGHIEEMVWIGKDVIAWASGVNIVFLEIPKKKQFIKRCINQSTGDGACCLSAHMDLSIFAFCEKVIKPRIFILDYPSMTKIAECTRGCNSGYLATAFTANDYLVSMESYPQFVMTLWSWRTGEKIIEVDTSIRDEVGQILRINHVGPTLIAQLGRTCGKLIVWSVSRIAKVIILKDHDIQLPNDKLIRWVDWCPLPGDPSLAMTDKDGNVYLTNEDGTNIRWIIAPRHCNVCIDYEAPIVCWFRGGLVLKTTFCQIRFYKMDPDDYIWDNEWYIKSTAKPYILVTHPFKSDWLFYYTFEGSLMEVQVPTHLAAPIVQVYFYYGANYRFLDFIYPWCHHVVTSDDLKEFLILESNSGTEVARISPDTIGNVICQASHPDYPLITLTTTQGEVLMINVINPEKPKIIVYKRLYKRPLDLIKFSPSGRFIVVGYTKSGDCFCISLRNNSYAVTAHVRLRRKITDVIVYDIRQAVRIFVLQVESTRHSVGAQFVVYDMSKEQVQIEDIVVTLDLPTPFRNICYVPDNTELMVGTPYLTRQLNVFKLSESNEIELVDAMRTNHQFKFAHIFTDRRWVTTTAFDGLVIVRNKSIKEIVAVMLTHHRKDFGTVKGIVNPDADRAIALGHNGSIVGMKRMADQQQDIPKNVFTVDQSTYKQRKDCILADYASLNSSITNLLNPTKEGLNEFNEANDLTWIESIAKKKLEEEEKACAKERTKIMEDFLALKKIVVDMLNHNETLPELERLPVSDFDLDRAGRRHAMKIAKDEREDKRLELEYNCESMNGIAYWIKKAYWDSQKVLAKSIFTIKGSLEVTNFPIVAEDPEFKTAVEFAEFQRDLIRGITKPDTFQSWRMYTEAQFPLVLENPLRLTREEERFRMDDLLQQEEREIDQAEVEEQRAFEGTTTYRFIEQSPYYYSQMESYGFMQVIQNNYYLMDDCKKLRAYFNTIFNEVYESKEREVKAIKDKISRIRHVNSELKIMFNRSLPLSFSEPTWNIKEKPENIVQVFQHEVKAKPYISPSQQEILTKQAMEAERIRQLLLADDFRERALMAMMDGVLEVRWEDIIKRDVPKPECMLKKQPEDYTASDIRAVKQYEKDVENLLQERERYKRILEADYVKVETSLRESVDRFNLKVDELFVMKMKVESALKQMELRYVRGCIRNFTRAENIERYERTKDEIARYQNSEQTLKAEIESLEIAQTSFQGPLETMHNREKTLIKKFRSEFPTLGRASIDLLERQYKRRPRINLKNTNPIDLFDLGRCVISRTKLIHLPANCIEYLKILEDLDIRPNSLPPSIEEHHWEHLIKIRRQRVELELKIRAQQAEIDRAQGIIAIHTGRLTRTLARIGELKTNLKKMKEDKILFDLNTEIQLVMRLGQVEIDLNGLADDSSNAILIPKKVIEDVNELIAAAGARKIKAMQHTTDFQRSVRDKEWEHQTLKMRIEDLQEDLRFVQTTNVTRDVQVYLKRRAKGLRDDKTAQHLERELETMQNHFGKVLNEWAERLREVGKKIVATRRENDFLDRMIVNMNVVRCEMEHGRDLIAEERQRRYTERKMRMVMQRSDLIKELQDNYAELLALQTEHELLRLRRYPALKFFRRLDDDEYDKARPC